MLENSGRAIILVTTLLLFISIVSACTPEEFDCITGFNPELSEYSINFTYSYPTYDILDEYGTPIDIEPKTYKVTGHEYTLNYTPIVPTNNILNETNTPIDIEPKTYTVTGHEYTLNYTSIVPTNNILNETNTPIDIEPKTYTVTGHEYTLNYTSIVPTNNILNETNTPINNQLIGYSYFGAEFAFNLNSKKLAAVIKFKIKNENDELLKNVEIDLKFKNELESSYLTNERGETTIEFKNPNQEYLMEIFHPLYDSNNITLIPEEYSGGIVNEDTALIILKKRSEKWANPHWEFGIPFTITPNNDVENLPVNIKIDFQGTLNTIDISKLLDIYSIKIIEVDSEGNLLNEKPFK